MIALGRSNHSGLNKQGIKQVTHFHQTKVSNPQRVGEIPPRAPYGIVQSHPQAKGLQWGKQASKSLGDGLKSLGMVLQAISPPKFPSVPGGIVQSRPELVGEIPPLLPGRRPYACASACYGC